MMTRVAVLLLSATVLAACGQGPQRNTARLLDQRLRASLATEIADGRAAVEGLPDGSRVTLLTPSSFTNGPMALDDKYPDIRAGVIEGMLDPRLMWVGVADTTTLPDDQRRIRVRNVEQYFADNGLGNTLRQPPNVQEPAATVPGGLAITIGVQCPEPNRQSGYGRPEPVCE